MDKHLGINLNIVRIKTALGRLGGVRLGYMPVLKNEFIDAYKALKECEQGLVKHLNTEKDPDNNYEMCPNCNSGKPLQRIIYGYTDDSDKDLNARVDVDIWLAGCVPDRYGVDVNGEWYYPKRRCGDCKKVCRFTNIVSALNESP